VCDTFVVAVPGRPGEGPDSPDTIKINNTEIFDSLPPYRPDNLPPGFPNNQPGGEVYLILVPGVCVDSLTVSLCGSSFNTVLHVVQRSPGFPLRHIKTNDDSPRCTENPVNSFISLSARNGDFKYGDTLLIIIEGKDGAFGRYKLEVQSFENYPVRADAGEDKVVTCVNPTLTLTGRAVGGLPPYSYHWLTQAPGDSIYRGATVGRYVLEVADGNGCKSIDTVFVKLEDSTTNFRAVVQEYAAICGGQPAEISAFVFGGTQPYTYEWSNGNTTKNAIYTVPGDGFVVIKDARGCTQKAYFTIGMADTPRADIVVDYRTLRSDTGEIGRSVRISAVNGNPEWTYVWSFDVGSTPRSGSGRGPIDVVWVNEGIKIVGLTISNGSCTTEYTQTIIITNRSHARATGLGKLKVYPNPNTGQFMAILEKASEWTGTLRIVDVLGRELLTLSLIHI
jgi:hypothetical protein